MDDIYNKEMKYKELCEALDLPRERGSRLQTQLREIKKIYHIEKNGSFYVIKGKLDKFNLLKTKQNPTLQDIIVPIIYIFLKTEKYTENMVISRGQLLADLGFINDNYYYLNYFPELAMVVIDENLKNEELLLYLSETRKMFNRALTSALNILEDSVLATVYKQKMTIDVYHDTNGTLMKKNRVLTDEQVKSVMREEKNLLKKYNVNYLSQLNYYELQQLHKDTEKIVGFQYFDGYRLVLNTEGIISDVEEQYPWLVELLNDTTKKKLLKTKRKNIANIPLAIREKLFEIVHNANTNINLRNMEIPLDT